MPIETYIMKADFVESLNENITCDIFPNSSYEKFVQIDYRIDEIRLNKVHVKTVNEIMDRSGNIFSLDCNISFEIELIIPVEEDNPTYSVEDLESFTRINDSTYSKKFVIDTDLALNVEMNTENFDIQGVTCRVN
ncbi:MAG: hypothetical protein KBT11_03660 [Treponema sp.]|nr:hypothetical protein [Candidatus Treponema equifaecale]